MRKKTRTFEQDIAALTALFEKMGDEVGTVLAQIDLLTLTDEEAKQVIRKLDSNYVLLKKESENWADAVLLGVAVTALFYFYNDFKGQNIRRNSIKLRNYPNVSNMVSFYKDDLNDDVAIILQNQRRKIKNLLNRTVMQNRRFRKRNRPLEHRELKRIQDGFKKEVKEAIGTGYIDKSGRRWKPETYADVVARTKINEFYNQTVIESSVADGIDYGVIVGPPARDACSNWIGRRVKLNLSAAGDDPTYASLKASKEIFHPNCRHRIEPLKE